MSEKQTWKVVAVSKASGEVMVNTIIEATAKNIKIQTNHLDNPFVELTILEIKPEVFLTGNEGYYVNNYRENENIVSYKN